MHFAPRLTTCFLLTASFGLMSTQRTSTTPLRVTAVGANHTVTPVTSPHGPLDRQMENTEKCGQPGSGGDDPFGLKQQFNPEGILLLHTTTTTTTTTTNAPTMPSTTLRTVTSRGDKKQVVRPNDLNKLASVKTGELLDPKLSATDPGLTIRTGSTAEDRVNQTVVDNPSNLLPPIGMTSGDIMLKPFDFDAPQLTRDQLKNIPRQVVPRMLKRDVNVAEESAKRSLRQSKGITEALANQICWQVTITATVRIGTGRFARFNCGGVIIGAATILTAAHCVLHPFTANNTLRLFKPNQLSVHIGDRLSEVCMANNSVSGSSPAICAETVQVSKIIRHPDFNPVLLDNDIALILLSSPIDLTNKPCACSLCLKEKSPSVDEFCMISGSNGDDEHNFDVLSPAPPKWLKLKIQSASTTIFNCGFNVDDTSGNITNLDTTICAGGIKDDDTCNGDSGGALVCIDPLTSTHYVAGVASFAPPCGVALGGMYTKVSAFTKWIVSNVGNDVTVSF